MTNVVWFCADQMRYDSVDCHGNPTIRTPNIGDLGRRGGTHHQRRHAVVAVALIDQIGRHVVGLGDHPLVADHLGDTVQNILCNGFRRSIQVSVSPSCVEAKS